MQYHVFEPQSENCARNEGGVSCRSLTHLQVVIAYFEKLLACQASAGGTRRVQEVPGECRRCQASAGGARRVA